MNNKSNKLRVCCCGDNSGAGRESRCGVAQNFSVQCPCACHVITDEYLEKATLFSHYGGSGSAFEAAAHLAMKHATAAWENDCHDVADAFKQLSKQFMNLAAEERTKQRETGFIKL